MNAIIEKIVNSSSGVYYQYPEGKGGLEYFSTTENITPLKVKREISMHTGDSVVLKLYIQNISSKRLKINSAVISDFIWDINPRNIEKVLVNGWVQSSDSGYIKGIHPTNRKRVFLLRDQNPYSFRMDFGYIEGSCVSEWYTQLCTKDISLVSGAITVDKQFCQFYIKEEKEFIKVRCTAQLDGITLAPEESIETEEIVFLIGREKESLSKYGDLIREKGKNIPSLRSIKGICCSYYAHGNKVGYNYIQRTVDKLDEIVNVDKKKDIIVEIDAGYCKWGDWLYTSKKFGANLQDAAKLIKAHGYCPGIWISPFVVVKDSMLYKEYPEWFVKSNGKPLESRQTSPLDVLPVMGLYVLDITKAEVQEYIKDVIKHFKEYGFNFIKIDFLYPSCFAQAYSKNVTRAQAIRMGVSAIREAAGEDTMIMSAISHLSPLVGLVNYARTGLDTSNPSLYGLPFLADSVNNYMLQRNINNYNSRCFYDEKIWINDIDCFVANPKSRIRRTLMNAHFNCIMQSKAKWVGDDICKLNNHLIDKYIVPLLNA